MKIIHGLWSPEISTDFFKSGNFYVWIETSQKKKGKISGLEHPNQIAKSDLVDFLNEIGVKTLSTHGKNAINSCQITLSSVQNIPLLSPSINQHLELEGKIKWQNFDITCLKIDEVLLFLKEIHFLSLYFPKNIKLGKDLEFWIKYAQIIREAIKKDHYIPALKHQKNGNKVAIYPAWEIISQSVQNSIQQYASAMPDPCISAVDKKGKNSNLQAYDKKSESVAIIDRSNNLRFFN